jgi:hypothetical protein
MKREASSARRMATQKIKGPDGKDHDATPVGFQNAREYWNEYLLDDGTIIRLKLIATEVLRIEGMRDANGGPVYVVKSTNVIVANAPDVPGGLKP